MIEKNYAGERRRDPEGNVVGNPVVTVNGVM